MGISRKEKIYQREKSDGAALQQKSNTNLEIIVAVADNEDDAGDEEEAKAPRMSCCYGLMVFTGLGLSLVGLTLLVTYVGFWSNYAMQGKMI